MVPSSDTSMPPTAMKLCPSASFSTSKITSSTTSSGALSISSADPRLRQYTGYCEPSVVRA